MDNMLWSGKIIQRFVTSAYVLAASTTSDISFIPLKNIKTSPRSSSIDNCKKYNINKYQ